MSYSLRVEPSQDEDFPRLMEIIVPAFQKLDFNQLTESNTPEGRAAAVQRHLRTKHEYERAYGRFPPAVKCIQTDEKTGKETIITSIECHIYDRERSKAEYMKPPYFFTADWVEDETTRLKAKEAFKPFLEARVKWYAGKPGGILFWTATDPAFQRLGGATKCVQWFVDRCMEIDVPAMLEASKAGQPVYERLGFEVVDWLKCGDEELPVMIKWPEHYTAEDKKPAMG